MRWRSFILCLLLCLLYSAVTVAAGEAEIIRLGATGEEVEELQSALYELGFFDSEPVGVYGPQTMEAVIDFQRAADLSVDGKFGSGTRRALKIASGEEHKYSELTLFVHNSEVVYLQSLLEERGYYDGEVDGIFGSSTQQAVRAFQEGAGLEDSGVVCEETWQALTEGEHQAEREVQPRPLLRDGDRGEEVRHLQERLIELGFLPGQPDGIFGLQTRLAVKKAQNFFGLGADGIVGDKTWSALEEAELDGMAFHRVREGDTLWGLAQRWNTSVQRIKEVNNFSNPEILRTGQRLRIPGRLDVREVEDLHWNQVDRMFPLEAEAIVTDVESGLSFRVQRLGGTEHADVEPLATRDTRALRRIYGGEWSWERRAVIVMLGNRILAGSINGYPHGGQSITHNNFNGHICLHFRGSRLHANNSRDPDHQSEVDEAADAKWPPGLGR